MIDRAICHNSSSLESRTLYKRSASRFRASRKRSDRSLDHFWCFFFADCLTSMIFLLVLDRALAELDLWLVLLPIGFAMVGWIMMRSLRQLGEISGMRSPYAMSSYF
jgi:hypothetical protein